MSREPRRENGHDTDWRAVVVAGGRATRLGGIDKGALASAGSSLVERAIAAAGGDRGVAVAVVGRGVGAASGRPTVRFVDESPRFGGPVAALAAGLGALDGGRGTDDPGWTLVLAGDLPAVETAVPLLAAAATRFRGTVDAVVAMDAEGRTQPLLALYRSSSLRRAIAALPQIPGASLRAVLGSLVVAAVTLPDDLCADVDSLADAARFGLSLPAGTEGARVA
jgi:molybdopterin-guanine dinucleotide biosynthesis protein A